MGRDRNAQEELVYERHLGDFRGLAGHFALIRGDRLLGVFPTRESAEVAWMLCGGPLPMYLRQITVAESNGKLERDPEGHVDGAPSRVERREPRAAERSARRPPRLYQVVRRAEPTEPAHEAAIAEARRLRQESAAARASRGPPAGQPS